MNRSGQEQSNQKGTNELDLAGGLNAAGRPLRCRRQQRELGLLRLRDAHSFIVHRIPVLQSLQSQLQLRAFLRRRPICSAAAVVPSENGHRMCTSRHPLGLFQHFVSLSSITFNLYGACPGSAYPMWFQLTERRTDVTGKRPGRPRRSLSGVRPHRGSWYGTRAPVRLQR